MSIPVIFEDDDILVIDKPAGMVVHPFDFSNEETVLTFLDKHYPPMFAIDNTIILQDKREVSLGGMVHKLDRDTSGVMVIAKNAHSYEALKKQFTEHVVEKTYIAKVEGHIEETIFHIDAPLGRSKKDFRQSVNPDRPRGELREAITDGEVLEYESDTTLVRLYPRTGRTHQLRAHMASIGHPIIGDVSYGSKMSSPRIMLHAEKLSFSLEKKGYSFEAPLPEDF